ncbi:MFS transporter [Candidatus Mycosynbacter amalyticus]|uniref:MFS transporter n=1 Tax=Candidatus Mycosynbacter amalyticus TaxID=2665156 RepID=A0A857MPR2_9BACT|nr:MFS transporter [Candidatus Mycosynbacter amalyticus]QHN43239.1 MFS transporter [Candidatus Mycosynbacter amalyticus]
MIQSVIHRLLLRRHFWRYATFSEVAELYAARLLRMTANSLVSVFVAVFLFKSGYSLVYIATFYSLYFAFKLFVSTPAALLTARIGPKHGMLVANLLAIPSLVALPLLPHIGEWALVIFTICQGTSISLYGICHLVDFSKVKHIDHAGKEISFMNIMDKIAAGVSPLIGGVIAWLASPELTMWLAAGLFLVAALPLLRTAEPVRVGQKLSFRGFPWRETWRSLVANVGVGLDNTTSIVLWPLFLTVVVFASSGSSVYAQIGGLATVTLFVGFIASQMYGVLIDRRRGGELLRYATIANSFTHAIRPFIYTPVSAALANVINETATTGYTMAFIRGMFDLADRSGHRIAYLLLIEMTLNLGSMFISLILLGFLLVLQAQAALSAAFFAAAALTLFISFANFPLYRRSK